MQIHNFSKRFAIVLVLVMVLGVFSTVGVANTRSYNKVQEVFDWGTGTTKVIVNLGQTIEAGNVTWDTFKVHVKRFDERLEDPLLGEGQRRVSNAYVSDERGNKQELGKYVTLEMPVGPSIRLGSALNYVPDKGGNDWVKAEYRIKQVESIDAESGKISGIVATKLNKTYRPAINKFTFGSHSYSDKVDGNITLTYASYKPKPEEKETSKTPLIIWLHGGGEGGTDPTIPLAANKAVAFASERVQEIFGGAYVLIPQCVTRWMDPSADEDKYDIDHVENDPYTSKYTDSLMDLIKEYVKANPEIDKDRIYMGGQSNGGFMTVRMMLSYPDYFAAGVPISEAMYDDYLTEADIKTLKRQNLWFISAATDPVVPASKYALATYDRLIKAGAKNVHLSYPERVIDRSGRYRTDSGEPVEYNGHWSWIYAYNNTASDEIDGKEVYVLNWLANQDKE